MPTYIYMGHGSDILLPNPNSPGKNMINTTKTVPEGCTYMTITETGENADIWQMFQLNKIANNPATKELLVHPVENYDELSIKLTGIEYDYYSNVLKEGKFHVKTSGQLYTNRQCSFLLDVTIGNTIRIYRSGLYDIESAINPPLPENPFPSFQVQPDNYLKVDTIKEIYKGSLFPTVTSVLDEIKKVLVTLDAEKGLDTYLSDRYEKGEVEIPFFKMAVNNLVTSITQTNLFKLFPGNHYNFSCRSYGNKHQIHPEQLKVWRQLSGNAGIKPRPRFNTLRAIHLNKPRRVALATTFFEPYLDLLSDCGNKLIRRRGTCSPEEISSIQQVFTELEGKISANEFYVSDIKRDLFYLLRDLKSKKQLFSTTVQFAGSRRRTRKRK